MVHPFRMQAILILIFWGSLWLLRTACAKVPYNYHGLLSWAPQVMIFTSLLATACLGVGATVLKDSTSSTEQAQLIDGSEHSVVQRTVVDDATSTMCVEFEFRTGEGLLDRHWTETFCGQELVAATPRLFDDALALERTDGPPCAFQIDWRALKLAPPSPVGCDSTEG